MFDKIAGRYDLLNRLLSLGIDRLWRKKVAVFFPFGKDLLALDLATGTADQLIFLFEKRSNLKAAIGMDMSKRMMAIGLNKVKKKGLLKKISFNAGDTMNIPSRDNLFDVVTISFGIRNMTNVSLALDEMYRVLKSGGRVLVLEFSLPKKGIFRDVYLIYLRNILPKIGALISGDPGSYKYLNKTIETFPYGKKFCDLLACSGFSNVTCHPLTFGIATIYQGDKIVRKIP